jgi:hypothetical protein
MDDNNKKPDTSSNQPPSIYLTAVGLVLLYLISAWLAFGSAQHMHRARTMIAVLFLMAIAIPFLIWRVHLKYASRPEDRRPLREWLSGEMETWSGRLSASAAATEALIPIAAVAFGMASLVYHLTASNVL